MRARRVSGLPRECNEIAPRDCRPPMPQRPLRIPRPRFCNLEKLSILQWHRAGRPVPASGAEQWIAIWKGYSRLGWHGSAHRTRAPPPRSGRGVLACSEPVEEPRDALRPGRLDVTEKIRRGRLLVAALEKKRLVLRCIIPSQIPIRSTSQPIRPELSRRICRRQLRFACRVGDVASCRPPSGQ